MEALELLLGAGLDRFQAAKLLTGDSLGQRPSSQDCGGDQTSSVRSAGEQGSHQPAQSSQFERKVRGKTGLAHSEGRGSDSSSLTPSELSRVSEPSRDWADRDVDERLNDYSTILTWPDEESGKDLSAWPLVSVSEHREDTKIGLQEAAVKHCPFAGSQTIRFSQCGGHKVSKAGPGYQAEPDKGGQRRRLQRS